MTGQLGDDLRFCAHCSHGAHLTETCGKCEQGICSECVARQRTMPPGWFPCPLDEEKDQEMSEETSEPEAPALPSMVDADELRVLAARVFNNLFEADLASQGHDIDRSDGWRMFARQAWVLLLGTFARVTTKLSVGEVAAHWETERMWPTLHAWANGDEVDRDHDLRLDVQDALGIVERLGTEVSSLRADNEQLKATITDNVGEISAAMTERDEARAEVERLRDLMTEAAHTFHGSSVLFSARFLAAAAPPPTVPEEIAVRLGRFGLAPPSRSKAGTKEGDDAEWPCSFCGNPGLKNRQQACCPEHLPKQAVAEGGNSDAD